MSHHMKCTSGVEMVMSTKFFAIAIFTVCVLISPGYFMRLLTMARLAQ